VTKKGKWKPARNKGKFLFPVKAMSKVFRARFVAGLRRVFPEWKELPKGGQLISLKGGQRITAYGGHRLSFKGGHFVGLR
jgi:hypothetical protein